MKRTLSLIVVILFLFTSCYDDGHYERPPISFYKRRVLVDASHDGGGWWFPQSPITGFNPSAYHQGKGLADLLRSKGLIVDELPRDIEITDSILNKYDKVIRSGFFRSYQASELTAYSNFLRRPSSLLLISEYQRPPSHIDQLAEDLGIQFRGIHYDSVKYFIPHSITAGATPFYYNAGAIVINEATNTNIQVLGRLNNATGPAVLGILHHPTSKIFFIGEINGLEKIPQPFTSQLFQWLFN